MALTKVSNSSSTGVRGGPEDAEDAAAPVERVEVDAKEAVRAAAEGPESTADEGVEDAVD